MALNKCMSRTPETPENWICNAAKKHKSRENSNEDFYCGCIKCLMSSDPNITVGIPQPSESMTVEQLESIDIVGVYAKRPEFYIPCAECHEGIPISDPAHVAAARSGACKLYHWGCTPEKMEDSMMSPYVLWSSITEENRDAGSCESVCGEDGEGAPEERLSGELEEQESGDDAGEDVG